MRGLWILVWVSALLLQACSGFMVGRHFGTVLPPINWHDGPVPVLEKRYVLAEVGDTVTLDASGSHHPFDRPFELGWEILEQPEGGSSQLRVVGKKAALDITLPGRYRILLKAVDSESKSRRQEAWITTREEDLPRVNFVAIGDAGTGRIGQYQVAEAIAEFCARNPCDFVIGLGDNLYDAGANSVDDKQFLTKFELPYRNLAMPFYMVLGNHDNSGVAAGDGGFNRRGNFQVAYTHEKNKLSHKWQLPSRYYHFSVPHVSKPHETGSKPDIALADFYALDSTVLTSLEDNTPEFEMTSYMQKQMAWLAGEMHDSKGQWRIAFAHHPFVSNGKHGNAGNYDGVGHIDENSALRKIAGVYWQEFLKIAVCDRVDLFIAGHDHNLQFLKPVDACGKTRFIVSGAGAKANELMPFSFNPAYWQEGNTKGFFWVSLTPETLQVRAVTVAEDGGWQVAHDSVHAVH